MLGFLSQAALDHYIKRYKPVPSKRQAGLRAQKISD